MMIEPKIWFSVQRKNDKGVWHPVGTFDTFSAAAVLRDKRLNKDHDNAEYRIVRHEVML